MHVLVKKYLKYIQNQRNFYYKIFSAKFFLFIEETFLDFLPSVCTMDNSKPQKAKKKTKKKKKGKKHGCTSLAGHF